MEEAKAKVKKKERQEGSDAHPSILELLPLRYPFLMVDRVLERNAERVVAVKNVTHDEWFFTGHFPERPIMPGTLLIEGMAQTAGVLVGVHADPATGASTQGLLVAVDRARFRRQVVPGDQVIYRASLLRTRGDLYRAQAEARVDGERVAEATLVVKGQAERR